MRSMIQRLMLTEEIYPTLGSTNPIARPQDAASTTWLPNIPSLLAYQLALYDHHIDSAMTFPPVNSAR